MKYATISYDSVLGAKGKEIDKNGSKQVLIFWHGQYKVDLNCPYNKSTKTD